MGGSKDSGSYRIPFEYTTAIKVRLSGLSRGSAGNGRARDTVNHLFVKEAFSEGRLSREADTYLCDPNATPRFPSGEGEHDETREVTCESCLDLMERWKVEERSLVEKLNEFEEGFRYPDDIHFDPEFWLKHLHQQVEEAEESASEGDTEHMVVEIGDTILVAWRAMQIFGDRPPEEILADRMDLNIDEKGYEAIMAKYTEWWRSVHDGGEWNWRELHTENDREEGQHGD